VTARSPFRLGGFSFVLLKNLRQKRSSTRQTITQGEIYKKKMSHALHQQTAKVPREGSLSARGITASVLPIKWPTASLLQQEHADYASS
jgi:hypothetical protein